MERWLGRILIVVWFLGWPAAFWWAFNRTTIAPEIATQAAVKRLRVEQQARQKINTAILKLLESPDDSTLAADFRKSFTKR